MTGALLIGVLAPGLCFLPPYGPTPKSRIGLPLGVGDNARHEAVVDTYRVLLCVVSSHYTVNHAGAVSRTRRGGILICSTTRSGNESLSKPS